MRLPAVLSAALATACLSFMVLAAEAAAEPIGQVIEQTGAAFVIHEGRVSPLGPGRDLDDADRIVTAGDGKVAIRFEDGSLCTIGPGSELLIGDLASPSGGWIDLVRGIVRVILAPGARAGASGVRTRAAVASVRSTEFVVEASLDRAAVFVASGTVEGGHGQTDGSDGDPRPRRGHRYRLARTADARQALGRQARRRCDGADHDSVTPAEPWGKRAAACDARYSPPRA
jgi:hypothetical protein